MGTQLLGGGGLQLGSQVGSLRLGQQRPTGLSLGTGLGLGQQQTGTGLGLQQQTGTGLGLGQQQTGTGLGLGQQQTGIGLGLGQQQTGIGLGLGQQQTGTGLGLGGGLGLGHQQSIGGLGFGQQQGVGLKLGGGMGTGLQQGSQLSRTSGLSLGGLNLAGTQKGLSSGASGMGIFSQQQQQQQQSALQQANRAQLMLNAVKAPRIFSDERDTAIMKFNLLQAYSGTGRGLASHLGEAQAVNFTPENPFCRFKTVCYSHLPTSRNEDGLVALQFSKPDSQLLAQQESIIKSLQTLVNTPNVQMLVDGIRPLPDNSSEMTIYILERSVMGGNRRLLAADVYMFLQNTSQKPHLERLGVTGLYPKTGFSEDNLKLYLQTSPAGITSQLWEQSNSENPDPQKYIPVPVIGSTALLKRMKHQEQETQQHRSRLEIIRSEIVLLERAHATTMAKIAEYKRRLADLSHRALKVMVEQESLRKSGYSVQRDEEQLRIRLEGIQQDLNAPLQFKGRLNELLSQIRMQTHVPGSRHASRYPVDPMLMEDIQQHLQQQQGALSELVKIIKEDFGDLKCIENGFTQT